MSALKMERDLLAKEHTPLYSFLLLLAEHASECLFFGRVCAPAIFRNIAIVELFDFLHIQLSTVQAQVFN